MWPKLSPTTLYHFRRYFKPTFSNTKTESESRCDHVCFIPLGFCYFFAVRSSEAAFEQLQGFGLAATSPDPTHPSPHWRRCVCIILMKIRCWRKRLVLLENTNIKKLYCYTYADRAMMRWRNLGMLLGNVEIETTNQAKQRWNALKLAEFCWWRLFGSKEGSQERLSGTMIRRCMLLRRILCAKARLGNIGVAKRCSGVAGNSTWVAIVWYLEQNCY